MLGGTDEEIMATNTFKEFLQTNSVIKMMDAFNQATGRTPRTTAPAEVIVPNTSTTDWSSLITSSTSEKELDKIMDQIDKAGAMSPELLGSINMKREGLTKTTTAPASDIEANKADINLISTPVSKIVEELSKLKTLNEKLDWLKNNNLLSPININGKEYNTIDYSDRVMVLMKVGKYNIPFYISTGQASKKTVKAGKWYAVFGIGVEKGWINKGSEEQINNNYGFQLFEKVSKILNEGIGVIESREDNGNGKLKEGIGFLSDSKQDLEAFNNNMNLPTKPAGKNTDTKDFYDHVNSTLSLLNNELKELAALDKQPAVKKETGVQAEILFEEVPETEQVTDAEFNEVLRLAAFFVENPKEPGTVGDAASKFPKLYQVLKALEQERYDAIDALNDKPDGTSSMPRKALARTKNKIDATYDKQIDTLRPGYDPNKGLTEVDGILVPEFMAKEFADVFTLQDLDNLLMEKLADFSLGLDSQYIDELRTRLRQELMKKVSFDIIEQGNIIIDEKGQAFYVTKKTKNQIKLRSFDLQKMTLGTEEKTVTKATLAKKVKNIYSKNMEVIGTTEETTPQEVEESKKLIDTISEIDSNQAIAVDYKNATGASEEDPINELTSLIKSCEE
jgi:hypothetical protein